ncbi:MAG: glycosyltransferase family 4 protein [Sedimentisphaerales bacterium]|nr:glycosyltransferase family 4 protein [Sedimentisphaerales bacterium]
MKVFMLGWEFPPFISGGLGTACYGLTKAMNHLGIEVVFVLPQSVDIPQNTHVKMLTPRSVSHGNPAGHAYPELGHVRIKTIDSPLQAYKTPDEYQQQLQALIDLKRSKHRISEVHGQEVIDELLHMHGNDSLRSGHYGGDMFSEVHRYAGSAVRLALEEDFDVVHAHDWMTYPAGIAVSAVTGKPLVVHIHSTEFDRSGEHVNQGIYDIERRGLHAADRVIAVSYLTRNIVISRYGVPGEKIEVVYNGVESTGRPNWNFSPTPIRSDEKIVLFLGRITMQKGPEYFLMAAKKVLEEMENVKFVMAGSGDMMQRTIEMAAEMGIGHKVLFTGFLHGEDVQRVYKMADLYVMPSVSEPFGIAPLEALNHDVPVLISKQSGVSEVLTHVLKVDFWDVVEMANKIVAVLKYPPLQMTLREHGNFEVRRLRWADAAEKCGRIYDELLVLV